MPHEAYFVLRLSKNGVTKCGVVVAFLPRVKTGDETNVVKIPSFP